MTSATLLKTPNLAYYQLGEINDWASLIFARVFCGQEPFSPEQLMGWEKRKDRPLCGNVFVIDPKFKDSAQWKLPGGHFKRAKKTPEGETPDKTPFDTAVREFEGETGIKAFPEAFRYIGKWLGHRGDHWKCLFTVDITEGDRDWMNELHKENEGERPKFFIPDDFYTTVRDGKFMPEHYHKLGEYALILPFT
jgi:8-oxo-dGTP pyrophosphatase MutT (NUDIX family)